MRKNKKEYTVRVVLPLVCENYLKGNQEITIQLLLFHHGTSDFALDIMLFTQLKKHLN